VPDLPLLGLVVDVPVLGEVRGVTLGVLAAVVVVALVVARFVAKLAVRVLLLVALAALALGVWVERDEVARCADTCSCAPFGRSVDVPFCRERLDEVELPGGDALTT
jgi:hypothetical protein